MPKHKERPERLELGREVRFASILERANSDAPIVDPDSRTMDLSFSSSQPVDRWFGREILSHAPGAADLSRLNDGANLLFNHDMNDILGVVEPGTARVGADGRGHATVRFAKTPRADEVVGMVNDRILRNTSFMYDIQAMSDDGDDDSPGGMSQNGVDADGDDDGDMPTYTATKWRAYEISIVSVPADQSVGIGRAATDAKTSVPIVRSKPPANAETRSIAMSETQTAAAADNAQQTPPIDLESVRKQAREGELARVQAITELGRRFGAEEIARQYVSNGQPLESARVAVLDLVETRNKQAPVATSMTGGPDLGLTDRELRSYSLCKAIMAQATNDWSRAGFERECSNATAKKLDRQSNGILVPFDVQARWNLPAMQTRAPYAVGGATTGGDLVQTTLLASSFIEVLRNYSAVMSLGPTVLSGLVGKVSIPSQASQTATYWVGESGAVTEAEATFGQITLSPKTLGALSKMSRLTLLQTTPAIEMLVRNDLARVMGLGIDLAALSGSGTSNQPTGIVNVAGIGSVVGGANGATISIDNLIALEAQLTEANAPMASLAYLANAKTIGTIKTLKSTTGQYLWSPSPYGGATQGSMSGGAVAGEINGYQIVRSNQMRSNLTKGTSAGVCSELAFGNWNELIIGEWGVLEVMVNPFDSTGFTTGDVIIRALQTIDIQVRHAASFAVMSDALTTI